MRHPPVYWSEGMFLRPHHFQAADRHLDESLTISDRWSTPYNYGLRTIQISTEALSNYKVQVSQLEARMPDGTLVAIQSGDELERIDLKQAFKKHSTVKVFLAAPKLVLGQSNVASSSHEASARFVATEAEVPDEATGGNDQSIGFLRVKSRLLLTGDDLQGYDVLPIAQIQRAGSEESVPQLDDDYIPPLLAADAWPPLKIEIIRGAYDIIGEKIEVLASRAALRGATLASSDPGDLDDLLMLSSLNEAYAKLHCLTFAKGVHPFWSYQELCGVVGALSIFGPSRRVEEVPPYDHDDLARIFKWAYQRIRELLGSRKTLHYEQRFFHGAGRGMQVAISPEWLHSAWTWYVGVNADNLSVNACRELLRPGKLDWKMASSQQVDLAFKFGMEGIRPVELDTPPRALPGNQGWVYYEVPRTGNAWKDVLATQTLALRFKTELIGNIDSLAGERKLEVVLPDRKVGMQFALFAVPNETLPRRS